MAWSLTSYRAWFASHRSIRDPDFHTASRSALDGRSHGDMKDESPRRSAEAPRAAFSSRTRVAAWLLTGILCGIAVVWPAGPASAATFYVRTTGRDTNDGLTPATAFATIGRAAAAAVGRTGHTIYVGAGQYAEGNINPGGSGRPGKPLQFVADIDGSATGDPGEVIVDATGLANGFRISARSWIAVNGFMVTNANEAGIDIKSRSDNSVVANCTVFSNRLRGIHVRDSLGVVVFNNLVYANAGTGIEFSGDSRGAADGTALNNTAYANEEDGIRIEETQQAETRTESITIVHNVIANNKGVGLNLKESSGKGFVGQWNLVTGNLTDDYNTRAISKGLLDLREVPLLVDPPGADGNLGGGDHADDDFHLRQESAGQIETSSAVNASPIASKKLGLDRAWTRTDRAPDSGNTDIGFHSGNKTDFVSGRVRRMERRLKSIRKRAKQCERRGVRALEAGRAGRGPCLRPGPRKRLIRRCGPAINDICP